MVEKWLLMVKCYFFVLIFCNNYHFWFLCCLVFDFKNLKIYEGNTDKYDAEITIDDNDLYDVLVTKKKTFRGLFNQVTNDFQKSL